MTSISSTDESFHYRTPQAQQLLMRQQQRRSNDRLQQQQQHYSNISDSEQHARQHAARDDDSDADSKVSGSALVDSCLRVLRERGVMNVGRDDTLDYGGIGGGGGGGLLISGNSSSVVGGEHYREQHYETRTTTYMTHTNLLTSSSTTQQHHHQQQHSSSSSTDQHRLPPTSTRANGNSGGLYNDPPVQHSVSHQALYDHSQESSSPNLSLHSNPTEYTGGKSTLTTVVTTRRVDSPQTYHYTQHSYDDGRSPPNGTTPSSYPGSPPNGAGGVNGSNSLSHPPTRFPEEEPSYPEGDGSAYPPAAYPDDPLYSSNSHPPPPSSAPPTHQIQGSYQGSERSMDGDPYRDTLSRDPYADPTTLRDPYANPGALRDPYGGAGGPMENPYGRMQHPQHAHLDDRHRQTPSPAGGSLTGAPLHNGGVPTSNGGPYGSGSVGGGDPQYPSHPSLYRPDDSSASDPQYPPVPPTRRHLPGSRDGAPPVPHQPPSVSGTDSDRPSLRDHERSYDGNPNYSYELEPIRGFVPSNNKPLLTRSFDDNPNRSMDSNQNNLYNPNVNRSYDDNPNRSYDGNPHFADEPFDEEHPPQYNSLTGLVPQTAEPQYGAHNLGAHPTDNRAGPPPPTRGQMPPSRPSGDDVDLPMDRLMPNRSDDPLAVYDRSHSPTDSFSREQRWRNPDLPEVIDFLSHPTNAIKANAAAYLQHLCYMDDAVKAKVRSLNGIGALVEHGVNNDIPEVHRAACGALRNLSYGRANDDNKIAIRNCEGIPALIRLLRKSQDNNTRELVTGILWNLSSCQELKKPIIDDGLTVIVQSVLIPHSGWSKAMSDDQLRNPHDIYWSTVFRNASGIIRNVSSDGDYARRKLRECDGLVDSVFFVIRGAIGKNDIDNKSVENCVCILRNLSFACQEVEDSSYLKRKTQPKQPQQKNEATGCFGGGNKKKEKQRAESNKDGEYEASLENRTVIMRGYPMLWQPEVVYVYLPLLSDCSNPETLEAAAGALQNLAACEWEPSALIRAAVRKEKGLPVIVELLSIEADRVVCAAATALRNLALNHRNKELIGKYAMKQLVQKLPVEGKQQDFPTSDQTITAVQATLYEVVRNNSNFILSLLHEGGIERLIAINKSRNKYSTKVCKFASSILYTIWQCRELHANFKQQGWKESDFVTKTMAARGGPSGTADNTLNRPRGDLGGGSPMSNNFHNSGHPHNGGGNSFQNPNYNHHNTSLDDRGGIPAYNHPAGNHILTQPGPGDELRERDMYAGGRVPEPIRMEEYPMSSPHYDSLDGGGGGGYHPQHHPGGPGGGGPPPAGGVPLFPNLPPASNHNRDGIEPVYAQVRKSGGAGGGPRRPGAGGDGSLVIDNSGVHDSRGGGGGDGGADSWV